MPVIGTMLTGKPRKPPDREVDMIIRVDGARAGETRFVLLGIRRLFLFLYSSCGELERL